MSATLTTGDALLQAIRDDPADDLPRLAFADWLEETGEDLERAEFIRAQVSGEEQRGRGLLLAHWLRLTPYLTPNKSWEVILSPRWTFGLTPAVEFRRGFVWRCVCPLAAWLEHGPALVRLHPIERVEATDRDTLPGDWWNTWLHFQDPHGWALGDLLEGAMSSYLPGPVWEALAGGVAVGETWKTYEGRRAAHDALSDALIALASQSP